MFTTSSRALPSLPNFFLNAAQVACASCQSVGDRCMVANQVALHKVSQRASGVVVPHTRQCLRMLQAPFKMCGLNLGSSGRRKLSILDSVSGVLKPVRSRPCMMQYPACVCTGQTTCPSCKSKQRSSKRSSRLQGRFTLLLGSPGSGKSTLLKALSSKLDGSLLTSGGITYNGHT